LIWNYLCTFYSYEKLWFLLRLGSYFGNFGMVPSGSPEAQLVMCSDGHKQGNEAASSDMSYFGNGGMVPSGGPEVMCSGGYKQGNEAAYIPDLHQSFQPAK
jgi:hypothetical protein